MQINRNLNKEKLKQILKRNTNPVIAETKEKVINSDHWMNNAISLTNMIVNRDKNSFVPKT